MRLSAARVLRGRPLTRPWCAVAKFAQEKIKPLVADMDEKQYMDKGIVKSLFEAGVRGAARCRARGAHALCS